MNYKTSDLRDEYTTRLYNYYNTNSNAILEHMKKLGYNNLNREDDRQRFIIAKLNSPDYLYTSNINIYDLIEQIKQTSEYINLNKTFSSLFNHKLERAIVLAKYVDTSNLMDFYNRLTFSELYKLTQT